MSKVLITGGAGYIGSHTNKALYLDGYDTLVLDNLVYGHSEFVKWGSLILGDLADREQLRLAFRHFDIQAVMHFAAFAYVSESMAKPNRYYHNNVINTLKLLDVMLEFGVKDIVFSSSCATYGIPQKLPISEYHPQNPVNPYGRTKLIMENILADYASAYGLRYVSLRYFNAAGADPETEIGEQHEPETHLIPLVLDAAKGRLDTIQIFGTDYETSDGTCIRDYIHVSDLAQAHVLALQHLQNTGKSKAFNLGNGSGFSVREVIECAKQVTCKEIPVQESPRRSGDPPILVADASRAISDLGWSPKYCNLKDIIDTAWKWHNNSV